MDTGTLMGGVARLGRGLAVLAAGGLLVTAGAFSVRGQGMPPAARANIHTLFDGHEAIRRTVTETGDGYVSVTESDDPALVAALREHVAQMEARLKEGVGVRFWDPAFPEYAGQFRDLEVRTEPTAAGLRVTVRGRTPGAVAVARNHARVVSDFAAHGWEAHDRSHPAALDAPGARQTPVAEPGHGGHEAHGEAAAGGHESGHGGKPAAGPGHSARGGCGSCGGGRCCGKAE